MLEIQKMRLGILNQNKDKKGKNKANKKEPYITDLEDKLMRSLGTKVNLIIGNKKGKIEIEFYGDDDLERLLDLITD